MRVYTPLFVIGVTLSSAGCRSSEKPPAPAEETQASELPAIKVRSDAKMTLTYFAEGRFNTVTSLDKVPAQHRGWVRVVDLTVKPERRVDHELVYVGDLRQAGKDGSYPYVVMSRRAFELAAENRTRQGATDPPASKKDRAQSARVVLYSTSWCPACRKARAWLTEKKIPFVEKDIEKDSSAAAELMSKAQRAGVPASGVPVLDVGGTLVRGFDPQRITTLLGGKK